MTYKQYKTQVYKYENELDKAYSNHKKNPTFITKLRWENATHIVNELEFIFETNKTRWQAELDKKFNK